MELSDPLFNPTELRKLAQDNGPEYAGRSRRALRWCADVLEAADVVAQESRGDDALILQLVEALGVATTPLAKDRQEVLRALAAGRARLEGKP